MVNAILVEEGGTVHIDAVPRGYSSAAIFPPNPESLTPNP